MAELLGAISAGLTLAAFSATLMRTSQTAYEAVMERDEISKDIKYYAFTFGLAGNEFLNAQKLLEELPEEVQGSDVGDYLKRTSLPQMHGSALYLNERVQALDQIFERIRDHGGVVGFRMTVKWLYRDKEKCVDVMQKTSFLQTTVNMMLLILLIKQNRLEASRSKDADTRNRLEKELASQKSRLKTLEGQYKQLKEDLRLDRRSDDTNKDTRPTPQQESMDSILKLSSNMRKHERVPPIPHTFSPPSSHSQTSPSSTSRSTSRSTRASSSDWGEGPRLRVGRDSRRRVPLSPESSRYEPGSEAWQSWRDGEALRRREAPRRVDELHRQAELQRSLEHRYAEEQRRQAETRAQQEIRVSSKPRITREAATGSVTPVTLSLSSTSDFKESITLSGHLNTTLQSDIISAAKARRSGLRSYALDDDDPRIVMFTNGSEARVVGKTKPVYVRIRNGSGWSMRQVMMCFLVYDSRQEGFALGAPFIQRLGVV